MSWVPDDDNLTLYSNSYPIFSEQEIEFDLQSLTILFIDEDVNLLGTLDPDLFTADPYTINLGDSFISFLEINFELYNSILSDCMTTFSNNYKAYSYSHYELGYFINKLHKAGIEHVYLDSLDLGEFFAIKIENFKKQLYVDLDIINSIKNFLNGLSGLPYPKAPGTFSDLLSHDLNNIFSKTPLMTEKLYCNVLANHESRLFDKYLIGKRYKNTCPLSFCITELSKILEANLHIKRCKNCGKYFIQKNGYNVDYCDRLYDDKGHSCKDIGASAHYKNKIQKNPIFKEYWRAYKRMYARVSNHKMSSEDFRLWTETATQKRNILAAQYESAPSDLLIAEFKQFLGNK